MFYREHAPPHFHAIYGDFEITVDIDTGIVTGKFPPRALKAVLEWREIHKDSLMMDWILAQSKKPLKPIEPLE